LQLYKLKGNDLKNIFSRIVLITLLAASFISEVAWGVDCSSTDITLTTQAEVDSFQATYGGGGVCDRVIGDLSVSGGDITNLDGLANITGVGGGLYIGYRELTHLDGLANITGMVGSLSIDSNTVLTNTVLTNLDGLANITSVGGSLYIGYNYLLTNLNGLANITSVGGSLYIFVNYILTNLNGLVNITSVVGGLCI
jgi:hypothetical protein